jgi:CheY-like chemotaxis protein
MSRKRILVVDDEAMVLDAVRLTLNHYGYMVETASNAADALNKLPGAGFDLLVTDLKMPGMTGDQLAREAKRRYPTLPVILLTGYPPEVYPASIDTLLLKPFSNQELRDAVERLTNREKPASDS